MKDINELTVMKEINNIENAKSKYFFYGFMISLIPYTLILLLANRLNASRNIIYLIITFTIITSILNAYILSSNIYKQLIEYFEFKYNDNYKKIKESIK